LAEIENSVLPILSDSYIEIITVQIKICYIKTISEICLIFLISEIFNPIIKKLSIYTIIYIILNKNTEIDIDRFEIKIPKKIG